jgi:solute carrier family 40 (iron-regulated transporter), member 1
MTSNSQNEDTTSPSQTDALLKLAQPQATDEHVNTILIAPSIIRRLYISHFLSTWNARVFEFGAVLYLARVFPHTLLPMSAYAFARGLAAIIFAPAVGQYIDKGNRLQVVRISIGKSFRSLMLRV